MDSDAFEEFQDVSQETIRSRRVITLKEKHDGQKQQTNVRLVAQGFQETLKPQSDSLKASKDSFKLLIAIAAKNNFKLPRSTYVLLSFSQGLLIVMCSSNLRMMSGSREQYGD